MKHNLDYKILALIKIPQTVKKRLQFLILEKNRWISKMSHVKRQTKECNSFHMKVGSDMVDVLPVQEWILNL
jgi:hypothetical protein